MPLAEIFLEGLPPNPNSRRHWRQTYDDNQRWKSEAFYLAKQAYRNQPLERAFLHYHITVGDNRAHDADNLIASLKPVQDGLKGVWFVDDDIDTIAVTYTFGREKPRGIRIALRTPPQPGIPAA